MGYICSEMRNAIVHQGLTTPVIMILLAYMDSSRVPDAYTGRAPEFQRCDLLAYKGGVLRCDKWKNVGR